MTDGHSRAAVAGIRALARAGVRVEVLTHAAGAAGGWSRHVAAVHRAPRPKDDEALCALVGRLAGEHGPFVVFPGQEETVLAVARRPGTLGDGVLLPHPGGDALLALSDKGRMAGLAAGVGLSPPPLLAGGPAEALLADLPPVPCVVKPPRISADLPAAVACHDEAALRAVLAGLPAGHEVLVQACAEGPLEALSLVLDRGGSVAACFASRALRLAPARAGASSLSVSVAPDRDVLERAVAMLRELDWWGLAHLQYMRVAGRPALLDVNVRFYGSMPLALAAGVNLPAIAWRVAVGGASAAAPPYRLGVRYRWMEGEIASALKGEPRRLLTLPARRRAGAMWDVRDPLPGALLAAQAAAPYAATAGRRGAAALRRLVPDG